MTEFSLFIMALNAFVLGYMTHMIISAVSKAYKLYRLKKNYIKAMQDIKK